MKDDYGLKGWFILRDWNFLGKLSIAFIVIKIIFVDDNINYQYNKAISEANQNLHAIKIIAKYFD